MVRYDLVVKGGTIFDGRRSPRYKSDIGITDGRIVAIGRLNESDAKEVIDASL